MYNKTILVSIEGKDFLGKSSQAKLLSEILPNAVYQKIPARDGITYERIYNMLKTGEAVTEPYFFQTLNATNRLLWQKQQLPILSSTYDFIVLDRWNLSTLIYGEASGIPHENCKIMINGIIEPDVCFVFDGEAFESDRKKDSYEKNDTLQDNVSSLYLKHSKNDPKCVLINANRDMEIITDELYNYCMKLREGK